VVSGELHVVVTDGFTGNVALKSIEGTAKMVSATIRAAARQSPIAAVGGLLMKGKLGELRHELSQDKVGGGIMLGLRGVAVAAHGSASPIGIANAVRLAQRAVDEHMVERTEAALSAAGALRSSEPAVSFASSDD
jgi:glycerol-3-phosphate acyltransferase PlsX